MCRQLRKGSSQVFIKLVEKMRSFAEAWAFINANWDEEQSLKQGAVRTYLEANETSFDD